MRWPAATLGEFLRVKHGYAFKGEYFASEGTHVLLTPGSFKEEGGYRDQGMKTKYYSGDIPDGFVLEEADLVIAMTEQAPGLLGSSAWIPESERFLHNQRLGRVVDLDDTRLNKRFLYYLFNTRDVREQISATATGGKVRHTAPERVGRVRFHRPPLGTQQRIADILSPYDDLIENNRQRMALLEDAARQLYHEWFVRLRFPGFEHTRITDGVPVGWERKRLLELAHVNNETISRAYDGEIEYIDISSVTPGSINETTRFAFRNAPSRARRVVKHGDIIWSCVRPNRRSHAVIWNPAPSLVASTGFAVISPHSVPTSFLLGATTTDAFVGYLENHARGAAYPAVLARDFEQAEILEPPAPLIRSYDDVAEPLLSQLSTLRLQNRQLRAARDLLLPRLMSGQLAV